MITAPRVSSSVRRPFSDVDEQRRTALAETCQELSRVLTPFSRSKSPWDEFASTRRYMRESVEPAVRTATCPIAQRSEELGTTYSVMLAGMIRPRAGYAGSFCGSRYTDRRMGAPCHADRDTGS